MYTLVIVDDEPAILEGMSRILDWGKLGFTRIRTAENSYEVVSHVVDWKPDLCLVDVRIGDSYGYELIQQLNEMGIQSNYIMMSGYDDFQYAVRALRCGALDYLLKPVDKTLLQKRVEQVIVEKLHGTLKQEEAENLDPVLLRVYEEMSPLLQKITMIVRMEYGKHISLSSISEQFQMNAAYIGQSFMKETGMKFSDYLMAYRMIVAQKQIVNTNEKIGVIAESVGYSNLNYFYQHFHSYFNTTPSEMRAKR